MRLSVSLTNYSWRDVPLVDGLVRAAATADEGGLDTVWVPDHLAQVDPTVPAEADDMFEAYSVLAYLASRTERVRLGALVTNVALRPPALLANAVATLDTLSGGRAWLGIGAGYDTSETADLGCRRCPPENGSSCSRRRSGSSPRCSPETRHRSPARTCGSTGRSCGRAPSRAYRS